MNKLSLIGLESDKEAIMESLMKMGVVEVTNLDQKIDEEEWSQLVALDGNEEEVASLEEDIAKISSAIDYLAKFDTRKKGLFEPKRRLSDNQYREILSNQEAIWKVSEQIGRYDIQLSTLRTELNKLSNAIATYEPWKSLDVPVHITSTQKTTISLGVVPALVDTEHLKEELYEQVAECYLEVVNTDKDQSYLIVIYYTLFEENVMQVLKQDGFSKVSFKEMDGTIKENIHKANTRIQEIEIERQKIEANIKGLVDQKEKLEVLFDYLVMQRDKKEVLSSIVKTDSVFMLNGWLPQATSEKVQEMIAEQWECIVEVKEPEQGEEFPVLLRNNGFVESTETITAMYSTPNSLEIDPNSIMAPFFVLFFGLMLSDAGYGILLALGTGFILFKYELEDGMRRFMKLLMYCGFATIFWGALFGGWFGNLFPILTGVETAMKPLWFNPIDDPERLLLWSLLFGVVHVYVGIFVRALNHMKHKKYLDAVLDTVPWYIVFTGFVFFVLPYLPKMDPAVVAPLVTTGLYLLGIGVVLLILTQGRNEKNIFMKLFSGIASLYDLVGFMSDVLSYSRLLALGLATSVIASIINDMGAMQGLDNIGGIVVFLLIFILGHALNFAINALGAYVHSSRLQYIEFFGKFYKGGGKSFAPFKRNTKYINLNN